MKCSKPILVMSSSLTFENKEIFTVGKCLAFSPSPIEIQPISMSLGIELMIYISVRHIS